MTEATLIRLKLGAALLAFAAGIGAVVTVVLLAHATPSAGSTSAGPQAAPPSSAPATQTSFPAPPAGSLVLAKEDRDLAVGLAVSRGSLQASVIGQEGPAQGLSVSFGSLRARNCGPGCYRAKGAATEGAVDVRIAGPNRPASTVFFTLPTSVEPGGKIVSRAERAWRSLHSLVVHDSLSSGPGSGITTLWRFLAPDRQTYDIRNGPKAVVIGSRRWDKLPGHDWQASQQDPIRQPIPLWQSVANAHLLGSEILRGHPAWKVSFFDRQLPAWFTIWVDKQTARTLELRMTAEAHFMHQVYGPFNRPLEIVPPTKANA